MEQRLRLVTLGVSNLAHCRRFFEEVDAVLARVEATALLS
jgi:hypothetical protein